MKKIPTAVMMAAMAITGLMTAQAGPGHDDGPYTGSSEFEKVKKLEGHWEGINPEKGPDNKMPAKITVDYHVTSGGSAVVETLFAGTPHEMVTVYHDEDGKLAVTHYCMMRNQPHMTLKSSTPMEISLEVPKKDASVPSDSCHMHALTLDVSKPNQLVQKWTSFDKGQAQKTSTFVFSRKS